MKKIISTIIIGIQVLMLGIGPAGAGTTDTVRVTATVGAPTNTVSISLTQSLVSFGNVTASLSQYRFRKPLRTEDGLSVNWDAIVPYEIRVYTDNGVGPIPTGNLTDLGNSKRIGFIRGVATATGTDTDTDTYTETYTDTDTDTYTETLPLKIWCPNFSANKEIVYNKVPSPTTPSGPALAAIGAATDYLWKGKDLNNNRVLDEVLGSDPLSLPIETDLLLEESTVQQDLNGDGDTVDKFAINYTGDPPSGYVKTDKVGEGASFSYIREKDTMAESTTDFTTAPKTRCILSWNNPGMNAAKGTSQGADLDKPYPVAFGIDLTYIPAGTYDSNYNGDFPIMSGQDAVDGVIFELIPY